MEHVLVFYCLAVVVCAESLQTRTPCFGRPCAPPSSVLMCEVSLVILTDTTCGTALRQACGLCMPAASLVMCLRWLVC